MNRADAIRELVSMGYTATYFDSMSDADVERVLAFRRQRLANGHTLDQDRAARVIHADGARSTIDDSRAIATLTRGDAIEALVKLGRYSADVATRFTDDELRDALAECATAEELAMRTPETPESPKPPTIREEITDAMVEGGVSRDELAALTLEAFEDRARAFVRERERARRDAEEAEDRQRFSIN